MIVEVAVDVAVLLRVVVSGVVVRVAVRVRVAEVDVQPMPLFRQHHCCFGAAQYGDASSAEDAPAAAADAPADAAEASDASTYSALPKLAVTVTV